MWVNKMIYSERKGGKAAWEVLGEGRVQGRFDFVVIAHNGKCANRLVGPSGGSTLCPFAR